MNQLLKDDLDEFLKRAAADYFERLANYMVGLEKEYKITLSGEELDKIKDEAFQSLKVWLWTPPK